jgi:hypothetical protein
MKPIKFDLPLNGTKISNLSDLEDNLCAELFVHFHSGKLAKWLRVRKFDEQAEAVEILLADENEHEVKLLKRLCDIFREVEESEARESLELYKKNSPVIYNSNDDEIEQLHAEIDRLNAEIETLKNQPELKPKVTCSICHGHGQVRIQKSFFPEQVTCQTCLGTGKI